MPLQSAVWSALFLLPARVPGLMAGAQAGFVDLPVSTVRRAAQMCGLKEVGEDEEWTVYWTDCSVSLERVMDMKRFQVRMSWPIPTQALETAAFHCCTLYRQGGHSHLTPGLLLQ